MMSHLNLENQHQEILDDNPLVSVRQDGRQVCPPIIEKASIYILQRCRAQRHVTFVL